MHYKLGSLCVAALMLTGCEAPVSGPAEQSPSVATDTALPTQTNSACKEAQYRQLDFWVGTWDLSWTNADGTTGTGTNTITNEPFGDCVITENFDGRPSMALQGKSVSMYSKPQNVWRQTWVDNQGGYFSLYGGPLAGGNFALEAERIEDKGPYLRMIWEDITDENLTWRWQSKKMASDDWADQWVITYNRR